jgi:hypothetical protein
MIIEKRHIAVGVDQHGQFWQGHLGMAPSYRIYDRSGTLMATRPNPYGTGRGSTRHHDNPHLIAALLPECGIFLAHCMDKCSKVCLESEYGIEAVLETEMSLCHYLSSTSGKENSC